ncbi:MAG: bifunctional riboflavin kinase/FAD synthetase [Anaerolineales bacterium]
MWVERGFEELRLRGPAALTIGAFDGVHRGHQALISRLVESAGEADLPALVVTFDPLPRQIFGRPEGSLLSSIEERLAQIEALGVDGTLLLTFDREFASTRASHFVTLLEERLRIAQLFLGPDFALGYQQEGDVAFLRQAGQERGFDVEVVPHVFYAGAPIHSSRIRAVLQAGDVVEARVMLGRPYSLGGTVVHGEGRGHELGLPTANLRVPPERLLPALGVYACRARTDAQSWGAVLNLGHRPTFPEERVTVEAHLLDFEGDLYDQALHLELLARLRSEREFDSEEALVTQIREDVRRARTRLATELPLL